MKKIKPFIKKHKILTIIISIALVLAIVAGCLFGFKGKSSGTSYSFIRTTTLQKGTLEDSISATGTVSSANTSKVTTALNYTVKSVNVSVGDKVSKGDTIITLDTAELEAQIEKEEQNLAKTKESANSQYESAKAAYNSAKEELSAYASTLSSAKAAYTSAKTPYDNAVSSLKSQQSAYDKALSNYNKAGAAYVKAQSAYNKAVSGYQSSSVSASELISAANKYMTAVQNCIGGCQVGSIDISDSSSSTSTASMGEQVSSASSSISVTKTANDICSEVVSKVSSLTGTALSVPSGSNTLGKLASKAQSLRNAKASCNFESIKSAYTSAKSTYEQAKNTNDQLKSAVSQAESQLSQAKSALENTSSDQLDELKSQLEECSLKAQQDGTVTALNATVGSTCNMDAAATIQDLTSLQVDITIKEADINNASIGQACHITSDASTETLEGTLTQIDPTSNNGSFGATVTITSLSEDIHIGMNASVEIIVSSSENVYQVPIDAVGEENGEKYVYRKTSGEGTNMEFEKVSVSTGSSNDYYIEIYSDELAEGDVVRSSADLSEGIETISSNSDSSSNSGGLFASLFGGSGGGPGNMPSGGSMPSGNMPSVDSSSDDRPTPPNMGGGSNG